MEHLKVRPTLTLMMLEYFIFGVFLITGAQCEVLEVLAEASSQTVLPCYGKTSSKYSSTIIWSKDNKGMVWKKLKSGLQYWGSSGSAKETKRVQSPHFWFEKGNYSLQINNVTEEDAGTYSCRVENGGRITTNVIRLRIIRVSISPSVTISGQNVSISCKVSPWPFGATVTWRLNNRPLMPQPGITSNRDAPRSVVREKVTARLTGKWTCVVAYNGKEGQASASLTLKGIVQPPKDNTKIYVAVGSAVTLPCVFSPGLMPSNPAWEKLEPGSLFKPASFSPSLSSSQPTLDHSVTLREAEFDDAGIYRCSATVEGQQLTRKIQLVFAKIDRSILSNLSSSVTLTCQLTDTSEVTSYEWVHVVRDLNGSQSVGFTKKGKTLQINKMSEETQGKWACRFYGKEGVLGNVSTHIQLMTDLSGQKASGFSHDGGAVIGLSCLALVLLLVLVKMYQNHRRRKRIFQYPALEAIIYTVSNELEEREKK